jgi:mRNA-degrading endonuclease toxin of MazEF toxin-antitoxin module
MIQQRDLLLVPFPFSDQSGKKVRPVIVLSNEKFNEFSGDLLVVGVTSNIYKDYYSLSLNEKDLEEGKLYSKCSIKVENILKLEKNLIIKKIGKIKKEKMLKIINLVDDIIEID